MADVWVCSQCRSINEGKNRCYKCRSPKDSVAMAPTDLPTIGSSAPVAVVGRFRSSSFRAVITSVCILGLAVTTLIYVILATQAFSPVGGSAPASALIPTIIQVGFARLALVIASLVTFAAWLSRVVDNIPRLTGSYPQATPRSTIVEVLVPFFNFFRIPAILREALRLLDPRGNGDALVGAAVLPLITGLLLDWPIGIAAGFVIALLAGSAQQQLDVMLVYTQVRTALIVIGSVMLVVVIARIERRSTARSREAVGAAA
jgi:hypothetical protein